MAIDFFSAQESARRRTRQLVLLLVLAVVAMVILTNLFIMLIAHFTSSRAGMGFWDHFDWGRFYAVGAGVVLVIFFGSLIRTLTLRGGGASVAEFMDARLVSGQPHDFLERRLLNIVEEMAIAAGMSVPQVYVLDQEDGINAFAAGFTQGDAVVALTRGALVQLNREELQGVIGHEFSHILNGDMRLNMRVIGLLFGVLMVASTGRMLYRWGSADFQGRRSFRDINRHEPTGLGILPLILSIGLLATGYMGLFFGNLIKAAVSRQREYLADASAVQFTRNPLGVADALKKIGGAEQGALLRNPHVEELSHAYFEEGIHYRFFNDWFATHPSLEERIRTLDPGWDGRFITPETVTAADAEQEERAVERADKANKIADMMLLGAVAGGALQVSRDELEAPSSSIIGRLPDYLRDATAEPYGARAVIYGLLLSEDESMRQRQVDYLKQHGDMGIGLYIAQYQTVIPELEPDMRLVLMELSMPALRQLSSEQYRLFHDNMQALIDMDGQVSVLEWCVQQIVLHQLEVHFEHRIQPVGNLKLEGLKSEAAILLAFLARHSHANREDAETAFQAARQALQFADMVFPEDDQLTLPRLELALKRLAPLKPSLKPLLLQACAASVLADGEIIPLERELVRAFASLLDAPMPRIDLPVLDE